MTILAELSGNLTVTADDSPSVLGHVEVTDAGTFWFVLDVDDRASVAFAQRYQPLGVGITINGVPVPDREIGNVLTITESRDSYGDRLQFQLIGERWSPFARRILSSNAHVVVTFVIGHGATEFRKQVFDGYVAAHTYDAQPPAANVTCLDAAALHAEKRAKTWMLPANSGRSRLSLGMELLALVAIPTGYIDLGGDGGIVNKPLAPGDQPVVDFIRDMWGILGAEVGFENGLFCARRYSSSLPPVMELNAGNILAPPAAPAPTITSPDVLAPNVIGVVTSSYVQEDIGGLRTVETSVVTIGPYAPVSATGTWQTTVRTISEVITRTTYLGTLDILTEQEEYGWYAVKAAPEMFLPSEDPPGYEIVPSNFTTFTYPDGSTRGDSVEQYRRLSKTVVRKAVDDDYNVIAVREEKYSFRFQRKAIWIVVDGENELSAGQTYLTDEGEGVLGGREVMGLLEGDSGNRMEGGLAASSLYRRPDELIETTYELNADGTIKSETVTEHFYDIGQPRRKADGAHGYGFDSFTYASRAQEANDALADQWGGLRTTIRRYRVINEDKYEMTERTTGSNEPARTKTQTLVGAPPRPERADPEVTTQEIREYVVDSERVALSGQEIERVEHNEFIETREQAAAFARILARRASARVLTCSTPIESIVHKFRMVRVNLPGTSIHGLHFYVTDIERHAATFQQEITAEYYSPELG